MHRAKAKAALTSSRDASGMTSILWTSAKILASGDSSAIACTQPSYRAKSLYREEGASRGGGGVGKAAHAPASTPCMSVITKAFGMWYAPYLHVPGLDVKHVNKQLRVAEDVLPLTLKVVLIERVLAVCIGGARQVATTGVNSQAMRGAECLTVPYLTHNYPAWTTSSQKRAVCVLGGGGYAPAAVPQA